MSCGQQENFKMDFWEKNGINFHYIVAAWLVVIAALSVGGEVKHRKNKTVIETNKTQYQDSL